ncbi:MarR family transcriptional regulator [Acetivibrio cellulolyticus]|uniref:MarR family transcriptional regulator n=1 Tax=Acetivibrio cellulolyticus TaxID=35830 RepID=UPI0001E2E36E|nr:MarR family transcriptional regulator [Acetivibrio cellulolyticus]
MFDYPEIMSLFIDNFKKLFSPEDWLDFDLSFSKSELFVLLLVDNRGEVIMSQVAEFINTPMSTATGIVDRLVKNKYLARERSDNDRRIVVIKLTDNGKSIVNKLKETISRYIKIVDDSLTDEERTVLIKAVMKVFDVLNKRNTPLKTEGTESNKIKKIDIE